MLRFGREKCMSSGGCNARRQAKSNAGCATVKVNKKECIVLYWRTICHVMGKYALTASPIVFVCMHGITRSRRPPFKRIVCMHQMRRTHVGAPYSEAAGWMIHNAASAAAVNMAVEK